MKVKSLILPVLSLLFMFGAASCMQELAERQDSEILSTDSQQFGSLKITSESRASGKPRYLDTGTIEKAVVIVSGTNMQDIEKKDVAVTNGAGTIATIEAIPAGKNRVVTVQAQKTIGSVLSNMDGVIIRAVTDINAGENDVTVNWSSTATGNVFYELIKTHSQNVSGIAPETVEQYLPKDTHPLLVDVQKIAQAIIDNTPPQDVSSYILPSGTVTFSTDSAADGSTAHINDIVSSKQQLSAQGAYSIQNVAPGAHTFYIINGENILFEKEITVTGGKTTELGTIKLSVPAPRLEDESGNEIISTAISGETKTVYLACRTMNGENPMDADIYYTTDGSEPTTSSTRYTGAGISVKAGTTIKAFAVKAGLSPSDIVSYTFTKAELGFTHPASGIYSPAEQMSWKDGAWENGAKTDGEYTTFALYSKNAEKVLLEIYDAACGKDALYDYWMEKGSDSVWRAKLSGNLTGKIYAFRLWGPNWRFDSSWKRGGSDAGFVSDCDAAGNRFNPNKVVFDPYARELTHDPSNPNALTHSPSTENPYGALSTGETYRTYDSGKIAPKGYVITDSTNYGTKPAIPQKDAIIYEAHVRGITQHSSATNLSSLLSGYSQFAGVQNIPAEYRGTYKGAALLVPYLKALGINTIELLPVHETDNDANPDDGPGGNFWGYMTFGYFAPDRRYSSDKTAGGPTKEFKEMVKAFHDAGMEVYLDVVYNHSGEGGPWNGAKDSNAQTTIVSMRGIDNSTYYSLVSSDKSAYWETTGCGNNLQCDNPYVREFILDSLEYWIDEMGVDGFRFDLATVLGREYSSSSSGWDYNLNAATTKQIAALGKAKNVEMIAESWDCGSDSYQVGNFPDGWAGWNGYYRDNIRGFVGNAQGQSAISYTDGIYGTLTYFGINDPSVNFVVAHDGFTLADLCSYSGTGNWYNDKLEWPFGPSDGGNGDTNNIGTGTDEASRRQRARNYFAMQMFSAGIPMIVYGDEFGRTQNGNNNPYNIDSVATWNNYSMIATDSPHQASTGSANAAECGAYSDMFGTFANTENKNGNFDFARFVMNERLKNESLRQVTGEAAIEWYSTKGISGWTDEGNAKAVMINGGGKSDGGTYYMMINMTGFDKPFTFPAPASGTVWTRIVDTGSWAESNCNYWEETDASYTKAESAAYDVGPYTVTILKQVKDMPACAVPVISGTTPFETSTSVTIECETPGSTIWYTTNGTPPTVGTGTKYTESFTITEKTTVKAIAVADGYKPSSAVSKIFSVKGQVSESSKSGVMLQGFNWDSAPRGSGYSETNRSPYWDKWYKTMQSRAQDIADTFAYVWFPPPSKTDTSSSEGYGPTELNNLNNCYGTEAELKSVIEAIKPAKAIADIVVNHRAGSTSWGDFTNPAWGVIKGKNYKAICSDDEGFSGEPSLMGSVSTAMRGAPDTGAPYSAYRDLDHTNTDVQQGIIDWMNSILKTAGFVGWRYDYVKGFAGNYVGQYNAASSADFSVGEYWPTAGYSSSTPNAWGDEIKNWITKTETGGQRSRAFDFALKGAMNTVFGSKATGISNSNYGLLANAANLMISQPEDAVTFIDNHDTGSTQQHWYLDPYDIGTAYALILTHPGIPCVAWQHYFTYAESGSNGTDSGAQYIGGNTVPGTSSTYRQHIDYLIDMRKRIGIEYDSGRTTLKADSSVYAAEIAGTNGSLIVSIGGTYTPAGDGYAGNSPIYGGTNFRIWEKGTDGEYGGGTTVELSVKHDCGSGNAMFFTGTFTEAQNWSVAVRGSWTAGNVWKATVTVPADGTFLWKALKGSYGTTETAVIEGNTWEWQNDPNNSYPDTTVITSFP